MFAFTVAFIGGVGHLVGYLELFLDLLVAGVRETVLRQLEQLLVDHIHRQ